MIVLKDNSVKRLFLVLYIFVIATMVAHAQLMGEITDEDGYAIPHASVVYKGHSIAVTSDVNGKFSIVRNEGWPLTISSVGFRSQVIKVDLNTPAYLKIVLKEDAKRLNEVLVKSKRGKYKRKDNPAVELMQRIIAQKKRNKLDNHDFFQYNKYQKITLALADLKPENLETGLFKSSPWLINYIEANEKTNQLILPLSVDETITQHIYRKNPKSEKDIIRAQKSNGINKIIQTGEILNTVLKDIFTDVDLYDDQIRLLQYPFTSPIADNATSFYRYYIQDTVYVDKDLCYHLHFLPNNMQDFGFRGDLYVLADSSLHVKKCTLTIPEKSDVNFVKNFTVEQEFTRLDSGEWVLTKDDMSTNIQLVSFVQDLYVSRTTRLKDYAFDELPKKLFRGKATVMHEADALIRDEDFWKENRSVALTKGEASMDGLIDRMQQGKAFKWLLFGMRAFVENYVETGGKDKPSKIDIGPVTTLLSNNFVDGFRFRASGRTTAHLNNHWFGKAYYAYGTRTSNHYYGAELIYSLNKKKNFPFEFPLRNITFESSYDVMSPSDKFLIHNKDNIFMSVKTQSVKQMYFFNRQNLRFDYETDWGFGIHTSIKTESNEPTGDLIFRKMLLSTDFIANPIVQKIRTTELSLKLRYNPGQTYMNTKQRRIPVNLDAPEFTLSHTMGVKNLLGGQYQLNYTELGIYKRFWLASWGRLEAYAYAGIEWNKVPFPLLIMPRVNLSFFEHSNTFSMMRNMEFLNDRYAFWALAWNMNGKILNRVPLIKRLKWREYIAFKGMYGSLTDKNNPYLSQNANDNTLFQFPDGAHTMSSKTPYIETVVGVHNVFKFFSIDWVHRFTYNHLLGAKKNGVRFGFTMSF